MSLVLIGVALYFSLQHLLMQPITQQVSSQVDQMARQWEHDPNHAYGTSGGEHFGGAPPGPHPTSPVPVYVACFDPQGQRIQAEGSSTGEIPTAPAAFLNTTLVTRAISGRDMTGTVDGGSGVGTIYREARAVRDPTTGALLGVVQVGRSIQDQQAALGLVRTLLVILGGSSLIVATLGGLLLSQRALVPASLAFQRQQAFIADASHELRTPLTLLRANAEVLLRGRSRFPAEDADLLEDIVVETGHMERLATDLLMLARLDAGQFHPELDVIDLSELADEVARRVATIAAEKGLTIVTDTASPVVLVGDRVALERAALILVDNAIKYTATGGTVTIRTTAADDSASLVIEDPGVGIAPEHLARLAERFYRVDRARARETGGAGLGLAIAKGIAGAHRGALTITSQPGQGTTAQLTVSTQGPMR